MPDGYDTRKWTQEDIASIKNVLPEGVGFGTLSSPSKNVFKLSFGGRVEVTNMKELADRTTSQLSTIGIDVEEMHVIAGYNGRNTPDVLLEVRMPEPN